MGFEEKIEKGALVVANPVHWDSNFDPGTVWNLGPLARKKRRKHHKSGQRRPWAAKKVLQSLHSRPGFFALRITQCSPPILPPR